MCVCNVHNGNDLTLWRLLLASLFYCTRAWAISPKGNWGKWKLNWEKRRKREREMDKSEIKCEEAKNNIRNILSNTNNNNNTHNRYQVEFQLTNGTFLKPCLCVFVASHFIFDFISPLSLRWFVRPMRNWQFHRWYETIAFEMRPIHLQRTCIHGTQKQRVRTALEIFISSIETHPLGQ